MFATGLGIVGRDAELAAIARFLDGGPGQTAYALLLEGDLGIGKSTVLGASLELARERQYRVLACVRIAHLGGGPLGARKAAREQQMSDAHTTMIATWQSV